MFNRARSSHRTGWRIARAKREPLGHRRGGVVAGGILLVTKVHLAKSNAKTNRRGAAAIEFALVALPFFALLLGILEIGILLLVSALVDTASSNTGRLIRTGQAQVGDLKISDIRQSFCAGMSVLDQDCANRTHVDVQVVQGYSGMNIADPLETGVFDPEVLKYQPGVPGDFVLVRIWFEHPVITPFIARAITRDNDNKVRLQTTLAFRNEPYL